MISTSPPVVSIVEKTRSQLLNEDPSGRTRVSQLTTLFDGKITDQDNPYLWSNKGTGTFTFSSNQIEMSVGVGEYCIRQSSYRTPYSSGKPQFVEATFDKFGGVDGVVKRIGYFSSSVVDPHDTLYDGIWLENDSGNISLKAANAGTLTMDVPLEQWSGYEEVADYPWDNFSVIAFDFLWLGGTSLRLFMKTNRGFVLLHEEPWASTSENTFIKSPNQYLRYEIRSTTASGELHSICSQVATEGSINNVGKSLAVYTSTGIDANVINTLYAIKSVKLNQLSRNTVSQLVDATISNTSGNDSGLMFVIINPTVSSPAVYTTNGAIEEGVYPSGTTVTSGTGRLIAVSAAGRTGIAGSLSDNLLSYLGDSVDGTSNEYVLAYMPITTNQTVYGTISTKEY